jgi:electron transport complex protein RnfC
VAVVAVGDRVLAGQKLAEAGGFVSAPVYSAISGTVKAIGPHASSAGENVTCITVENDGLDEWVNPIFKPENNPFTTPEAVKAALLDQPLASMDKSAIRGAIREAGVVGLGGAGFPAAVKLTPPDDDAIDCVIINAAECEPYLTSDYRLMLERPHELLAGCTLLLKLFPKARCVIGIENNKPAAIKLLAELCKEYGNITVCPLKAKYPQGGERMLISAVTGRKLNSSLLPSAVGCVVMNVASVIASFRACALGAPLTHRIMTVTGDGVTAPCNIEVPIGISHRAVLEAVGGFDGEPRKIISGGPMMGTAIFTTDIPVTKTSASILAFKADPVALHDTSACIRCGKCLAACPERLVPTLLAEAAEQNDLASFEKYGGMECIECGSCAYVCPAKRYLVQSMRYGKRQTGAAIRARKAAEQKKAAESTPKGGNEA